MGFMIKNISSQTRDKIHSPIAAFISLQLDLKISTLPECKLFEHIVPGETKHAVPSPPQEVQIPRGIKDSRNSNVSSRHHFWDRRPTV